MQRLGLVALGDSITNGRGTMVMGVTPKSWAQWLAEALDLPYTGRASDGAVVADIVAEQLPRVRADYDVACVYAGVNDVRGLDFDAPSFERDLRTVLTTLAGHAEHLLTLTIPLDLGRPPAGAKVAEANAIIRGLAQETGATCGALDDLRGARSVMPDAVHPTAIGQLEIADIAAAALAADGVPVPVTPSALAEVHDGPGGTTRYRVTYGGWLARDLVRRGAEAAARRRRSRR